MRSTPTSPELRSAAFAQPRVAHTAVAPRNGRQATNFTKP